MIGAARRLFPDRFHGVIRVEVLDASFSFWIDGRDAPPVIGREAPRDLSDNFCLWRIDYQDLMRLCAEGGRRLDASFIAGRLKISGDMAVMARLEIADA